MELLLIDCFSLIFEKCYDIFNDCSKRTTDTLYCDRDSELQTGCRMFCNMCNQQQQIGSMYILHGVMKI